MKRSFASPTTMIAALLLTSTIPAAADGKKDCTSDPQSSWKKQSEAEAAAKSAGFEVRRSKIEGSCYEGNAVKDNRM